MLAQLRANVVLLVATLIICSVLYPLVVLAIGWGLFTDKASGSLLRNAEDKVVGSRLIAQQFKDSGYFQPRPSAAGAAGYNASASSGSNWAANNILLRDRVARQLATLVVYHSGSDPGSLAGPDVAVWFLDVGQKDLVTRWAKQYPTLAATYVKTLPDYEDLVKQWKKAHPDTADDPEPKDIAADYFPRLAKEHPHQWPVVVEEKTAKGETEKKVKLVPADPAALAKLDKAARRKEAAKLTEIQEVFFDPWLQATQPDLEKVPADMVTASGSGLDPHISRASALYQKKYRVLDARIKKLIEEVEKKTDTPMADDERKVIAKEVEKVIDELLGSEQLVNVLEINLALDQKMKELARKHDA